MIVGRFHSRNPAAFDQSFARARTLHVAEGVLVGMHRYSPEDALSELIDVAHVAGVSTFALAKALVAAASGATTEVDATAAHVVRERWGALLATTAQT